MISHESEELETVKIHTIAERPDLRPALERADEKAYPRFLLHSELTRLWPAVYEEFPEYQLVLCDEETGLPAAHGNSVPFVWDGTPEGLPTSAVSMVELAREQRRAGARPTALGALQAVVHPERQGGG